MSDRNADEAAVLERVRDIARAFDARDLESLLSFHYRGPEASIISSDGALLTGWEEVSSHLEMSMNEFQYSRTRIDHPTVFVGGDLAVVTYGRRIDSRLHDIEFVWEGWVTDVFKRDAENWLRLHHHGSEGKR